LLLKVQELTSRQLPATLQGTLDLTELFRNHPEYHPLSPLQFDLTANPAEDLVFVTGSMSCEVRMQCSRCLETFDETVRVPFDEQFRKVSDEDEEANEDDEEAVPVTEEKIDLTPYIMEEFVVQLPYAPLCNEDCRGLCSECGTNLNEQSCGCNTERVDPRMAALQDWFKSQKE